MNWVNTQTCASHCSIKEKTSHLPRPLEPSPPFPPHLTSLLCAPPTRIHSLWLSGFLPLTSTWTHSHTGGMLTSLSRSSNHSIPLYTHLCPCVSSLIGKDQVSEAEVLIFCFFTKEPLDIIRILPRKSQCSNIFFGSQCIWKSVSPKINIILSFFCHEPPMFSAVSFYFFNYLLYSTYSIWILTSLITAHQSQCTENAN